MKMEKNPRPLNESWISDMRPIFSSEYSETYGRSVSGKIHCDKAMTEVINLEREKGSSGEGKRKFSKTLICMVCNRRGVVEEDFLINKVRRNLFDFNSV